MPDVSSSIRTGEPVAVSSVTARSWASSSARLRSLRSALIDLYMCDAARLTVTWSGWSPGRWWTCWSTRSVVARSSGSMPVSCRVDSGVDRAMPGCSVTGGSYGGGAGRADSPTR